MDYRSLGRTGTQVSSLCLAVRGVSLEPLAKAKGSTIVQQPGVTSPIIGPHLYRW